MDNYYEILGVERSASEESIREAIRGTRKRYRQVAGSPNKEQARNAEVMMDKLAAAETELLDPARRKAYDTALASTPAPTPVPATVPAAGGTDWVETAKSYLANGQPRNAAQAAKQATMERPDDSQAWVVRAYAALELKDYADADFAASEAHRREPADASIAGLLGDVYDGERDYVRAEQAFGRAAQLEPDNPYWQGRVAWAMVDQNRVADALRTATELTRKFPESAYAGTVRAFMLLRDAENSLSRQGDGIYVTNKAQIAHLEQRLTEVREIGSTQEGVLNYYAETQRIVEMAKKRRFTRITFRRIMLTVILAIIMFIAFGAGAADVGIIMLLLLGLWVWWTIERCWPRQWKVNKKELGAAAKTGLQ